ncbi:MAG: phosphoribosyltransferase [Candidatus Methylomirabilales bacterium]
MFRRFRDRVEAGRELGEALGQYAGRPHLLVLALPRGGVPVGWEIAQRLQAPLDLLVVRKLGVPGHPELAMGAIASGGGRVLNEDILEGLGIGADVVARVEREEAEELRRREAAYRGDRPPIRVHGRTIILADDGIATGATMRAGVLALQQRDPAAVVVATPVASAPACAELAHEVEVVCLETPEPFRGVGAWYERFEQVSDEEVRVILARSFAEQRAA